MLFGRKKKPQLPDRKEQKREVREEFSRIKRVEDLAVKEDLLRELHSRVKVIWDRVGLDREINAMRHDIKRCMRDLILERQDGVHAEREALVSSIRDMLRQFSVLVDEFLELFDAGGKYQIFFLLKLEPAGLELYRTNKSVPDEDAEYLEWFYTGPALVPHVPPLPDPPGSIRQVICLLKDMYNDGLAGTTRERIAYLHESLRIIEERFFGTSPLQPKD